MDGARDSGVRAGRRAAGPRARILVADDNADMRDYVVRLVGTPLGGADRATAQRPWRRPGAIRQI